MLDYNRIRSVNIGVLYSF